MRKIKQTHNILENLTRRTVSSLAIAIMLAFGIWLPVSNSYAATPAAATLNADNTTTPPRNPTTGTLWNGDRAGGAAANGEADCANPTLGPLVCDSFQLTLTGDFTNKRARVQINWNSPTTDYDMYIHKDSISGPIIATSAAGTTTFEQADIDPSANNGATVYFVRVIYFAALAADQYRGVATVVTVPAPFVPPTVTLIPSNFQNYKPPCSPENYKACDSTFPGYNAAGEPSIGVNWNTGNVLFQANLFTLRTTFNDMTSPATDIWVSRQAISQEESLDPIMFTDSVTGRTISGTIVSRWRNQCNGNYRR